MASVVGLCLAALCWTPARGWADPPSGTACTLFGPPVRPNIILILTDDQDQLLGSLDFMPLVRQLLADRGVTFENFFVPGPWCCPSRASILRGQCVHSHEIWSNSPPDGGFPVFRALGHENSTIATWLRSAGYRTVLLGKYLNGYPGSDDPTYIPPGWSEWYVGISGITNLYYNYILNENGQLVQYGSDPQDYSTDVLTRKAVDFINRAAADQVPFFLYAAPVAPHAPATPAPRHADLFPDEQAPRTPSFNEDDVSDKPRHIRNLDPLTPTEIAQIDELHRLRLRSLQAVDEMVAALVRALRDTNTLINTFIFFTSDNGFHLGQHRLPAGKEEAYEEDIRVPLLICGPGVPAGRTLEYFANNIDLAPTFADLAAVTPPDFVEGRSLVPLLGSQPPGQPWRQITLVELFADQFHFDLVRTTDYKYVERIWGERELYHRLADPYELESLHDQGYDTLMTRLAGWLAALRTCSGATCRDAENPLPGDVTGNACVNSEDVGRVQSRLGQTCFGCPEDLNGDWVVDGQDLDIVVSRIGLGCSADLNCDGVVNNLDIDPFVLALLDPAAYGSQYPACDILNGDLDGDGAVNGLDIPPFVECVLNGGCP